MGHLVSDNANNKKQYGEKTAFKVLEKKQNSENFGVRRLGAHELKCSE